MVITTINPETADLEKSYLSNPYGTATLVFVVKNADRFVANDRIMIGEMGEEKTEVVTVLSVSTDDMTITLAPTTATLFSHEADTPVYKLRFDTVKYYRSTTGINGPYTFFASEPLDVDNANLTTIHDDSAGVATNYYKTTVFHSVSTLESAFTDPIPGGGYARDQVGYLIDQILEEVGDQNEQHISRSEILGYFNDVNDDLLIGVAKPYEFLKTRVALKPVAGQRYLNYPTDVNGNQTMWKFDHMDYNYIDNGTSPVTNETYTLDVEELTYFRNKYQDNTISTTTETDNIHIMTLDDSVDRFRFEAPFLTNNGTLYLHMWQFFPVIDSEGDVLITPTAKIYKLYTKAMYYAKRMIIEPSFQATQQTFQNMYALEKASYSQHNRKDKGTPRAMRPRDSVDKGFRIR